MPRPLWTGSLSFGLVNVPVALFSAVRDRDLHFNQLHEPDAARIETRRFCAEEDREVPYEEIGRAYDLDDDKTVILTDEELETVAPRKTRTIDIEAFVDAAEIDPIYYDHPYFLAPVGDSEGPRRAYRLLVEAMGGSERVAIGRFVMRTKEYLVAVRVREQRLSLTTLLFGDEVRSSDGIDSGGRKPAKAAREQALALVEALAADWEPERYEDEYRKRLQDVVARKRKGKRISAPKPEQEPSPVPDLMAALERSLEEAKGGGAKKRRSSGTKSGGAKRGGGTKRTTSSSSKRRSTSKSKR